MITYVSINNDNSGRGSTKDNWLSPSFCDLKYFLCFTDWMVSFKCVFLLRPSYMNGTARRGMFALLNSYGVSINLERVLVFPFSSFLFWLCIYLLLQVWTYQWRVVSINFFLSFLVLTQNGHIKSYSQFEFNKIIFNLAHSHAEWLHNYLTTDRP